MLRHFGREIIANNMPGADAAANEKHVEVLYHKTYSAFVEAFDAHDNGISAYPADIKPAFERPWDIFAQVGILNPGWNEVDSLADVTLLQAGQSPITLSCRTASGRP